MKILFEDDYLFIINKLNNVLVHHSHYARNITSLSIEQLIEQKFGEKYHLVHRLDYKTSGVLMLVKKKEFIKDFQQLFLKNEIEKQYIAVVRGFINSEIEIITPVKHPETKVYKEAETKCIPLASIETDIPVQPYSKSRYSLVKLKPKTGRIHQLRIHMNKISHPIVGDYKYGDRFHNRMFESELHLDNLFLHAYQLKFKHPFTNKELAIKAPLPKNWDILFEKFNWKLT